MITTIDEYKHVQTKSNLCAARIALLFPAEFMYIQSKSDIHDTFYPYTWRYLFRKSCGKYMK